MIGDLRDSIRYSLSDRSGALRFIDFRVIGGAAMDGALPAVRAYLVGRDLHEADPEEVFRLSAGQGHFGEALSSVVAECKELFAGSRRSCLVVAS